MSSELDAIMNMTVEKRYKYLIDSIREHQKIWILVDDHGCVMLSSEDEDCVPIWPTEAFAKYWATNDWSHCQAHAVSVEHWLSKWTHGLEDDDVNVAVFPNPNEIGLVLFPDEFAKDII